MSPRSGTLTVQQAIAARVAKHLEPGQVVNLGIGIPTLVPDYLPRRDLVVSHTENGLLGVGPSPRPGEVDPHLVNAGKLPVTSLPGAGYFDSAASFGMIRGGHVDVAVLGTLQVDRAGRIANWALPGRPILGVGGAMDLLVGARKVIVATTHLTKDGRPKLVERCAYPLTSDRSADLVVTERATFAVVDRELVLVERNPGTTLRWLAEHTEAPFTVARETPERADT